MDGERIHKWREQRPVPVMEIAFRKASSIQEQEAESMGVCVCVVGFMCEVEDVPFCHLFFLLEEGSKAIS